jgi:nitrogen fixation NifU-like protein
MADVRELYQQVIIDHDRKPRNFGALAHPSQRADGHNPLCGDRVTVEVEVADGVIREVAFQGTGCAISRASASLMTAAVKGKPVAEAEATFARFRSLVMGAPEGSAQGALGKLEVFAGVREFPSRIKCATLPWHTLHAALAGAREAVTTE